MLNYATEIDEQARLLHCGKCGQAIECSRAAILQYLNGGWPKCCGETMTLFIEARLLKEATAREPNAPRPDRRVGMMEDPTSRDEWQLAVDGAQALLHLRSAQFFDLASGGVAVNVERCQEILSLGRTLGITPRPDSAEWFAAAWNVD
jgi:hypothetical protein